MADSDTCTVTRSTAGQAEPARGYEQIEDFRRWPTWSPWEELDPDFEKGLARRKQVSEGATSG